MKPTNELRFVERFTYQEAGIAKPHGHDQMVYLVFQQKWVSEWESIDGERRHEWRDVPVEAE